MQINDCIADALGSTHLNDLLLGYYQDNGAVSNNLNEAEYEFLLAQGMTAAALPDMWEALLSSLGYTGSLTDMWYEFWCVNDGVVAEYIYFWELIDSLTESSGMTGSVTRDSAASYIDTDGVLQIADGDDTPFSHDSIEDETDYTDIRGSFVDDSAWFDGAVLGSDLLAGWDLTSGWGTQGTTVIDDADSFTSTGNGGVTQNPLTGLTIGKEYSLTITLSSTATDVQIINDMGLSPVIGIGPGTYIFTATTANLYLRNIGTGTTDITLFEIKEVTASLADYADTGNMLIIDDTAAKGYGFIGEVGTGETLATNLFDQDGGEGGSGDKGAFTLADLRLAELDSGALTVGTMYEISAQDGEDFTADGAPDNVVGTTFVATGTNVTLDANYKVYPVDISWTPYGMNTIEIDDGALKISYVDDGAGASLQFNDGKDFTADLEVGKQYKLTGNTKVGSGDNVHLYISTYVGANTETTITSTTFVPFEFYFTASHATYDLLGISWFGAGEEIWLDNLQISEITEPSATAVHIYKEYTLENEGWNALDTGIDYNAGAWEFDVYTNLMFEYPDLITNGNMELDSNWANSGTPTTNERSSTRSSGGTYSRHIVADAAAEGCWSDVISITSGLEYKLDLWVWVVSGQFFVRGVNSRFPASDTVNTTGEWVHLQQTLTGTSTGLERLILQSANTAAEFYVDDVQFAQTDSSAQPRFEINGLLSEGEATNYCLQSNDFDTWTSLATTETLDETGPDGVANSAWTIQDNSGSSWASVSQTLVIGVVSGVHTFSVFVKEGVTNPSDTFSLRIQDTDDGNAVKCDIDFQWIAGVLSEKTAGTGTSTVKQLGSTDWWKAEVHTAALTAGNKHKLYVMPTEYLTDPGSSVTTIFYGAQFEPTPYATSYIPTTTIPVTRTADAYAWTMSTAFKNLMGNVADSPFTMVCEWTPKFDYGDTGGDEAIISIKNDVDLFYTDEDGKVISNDGTVIRNTDPNYAANTTYLFALRVYDDSGLMSFKVGEKHGGFWTWAASPAIYDGSFNPATELLIGYLNQYPFNIKNIYFYDEKTQAWIEDEFE